MRVLTEYDISAVRVAGGDAAEELGDDYDMPVIVKVNGTERDMTISRKGRTLQERLEIIGVF